MTTDIALSVGTNEIYRVSKLRIMNQRLKTDGGARRVRQLMHHSSMQALRMVRHIAKRQHGLKKDDTLFLLQALVISRLVHSIPCLPLRIVDRLLRTADMQVPALLPETVELR